VNVVPGHRRERTSFTEYQLSALRAAYARCRYLTEDSRQQLASKLGLDVSKIKVWFQNRRASDKKTSGVRNGLALRLMADGLYDHSTRPTIH
jgi:homeobox protein engrailed